METHHNSSRHEPHKRGHLLSTVIGLIEIGYHFGQFLSLALLTFIYSHNYLWSSLFLFILFIDFVSSMGYWTTLSQDHEADIGFLDIIPIIQLCSIGLQKKRKLQRGIWTWFIWQNVFWGVLMVLWIRPGFLYMDAFGGEFLGARSLSGRSSCSRLVFYEKNGICEHNGIGTTVYHPLGAFTPSNPFQSDGIYANCYLNQTWPSPTYSGLLWIGGFQINPISKTPYCDLPLNGGSISRYNCPGDTRIPSGNTNGICLNGYPGLWYGALLTKNTGLVYPNTTSQLPALCPGTNKGALTPGDPPASSAGDPICSYCLWYTIYHGGSVSDKVLNTCLPGWNRANDYPPTSWAGWKSYPDGTTDPSWSCSMCPGRGGGGFGFNKELYGDFDISISYWLATTIAFFIPAYRKLAFGCFVFGKMLGVVCPKYTHIKSKGNYQRLHN